MLLLTLAFATPEYAWPTTEGAWVTAHFDNNGTAAGDLDYACGSRAYDRHKGTDIGVGRGTVVRAAAAGTVVSRMDGFGDGYIGNYSQGYGFGNHVVIDHGAGDMTIYGHLSAWSGLPATNDVVDCGASIGGAGTSGNSSGVHLHFETRLGADGAYLFSGWADDPYAGSCSGPLSYWTDQNAGNPTATCADGVVIEPDACDGHANGDWCDGDDLITCQGGREVARDTCANGCASMPVGTPDVCHVAPPDACDGLIDGLWCDGDDLVDCDDGEVSERFDCDFGCTSMPYGTPDQCAADPDVDCMVLPAVDSPTAPTTSCNYMDWELSPDGYYLISRFGADTDPTTWGRTTTCGYLQGHYDYNGCAYDVHSGTCAPGVDPDIPWVQGHVDYVAQDMFDLNDLYRPGDVPVPEYFYVAGAQRFGCGAVLRVTNPESGLCVVAYAEDGGPGATYEGPAYGGRRILDASPAVSDYLEVDQWGWASADLVFVESGLPGDVPGQACSDVCVSTPMSQGADVAPWDPNHMQWGVDCR